MSIFDYITGAAKSGLTKAADAAGLAKPAALGTVSNEIAQNDATRAAFAQQLANYQNRTAPQQQGASVGPTHVASTPGNIVTQQSDPSATYLPGQASAAPTQRTNLGPAQSMQAAQVGPAHQMSVGGASTGQASAGQVDTGGAVRQQQLGANSMLQSAANGSVPSAAEEQLKRGTAANIAGQYALARTAHGAGRVGALGNAQNNAEQANAELGSRQAELRAGEQANARNAYVQALAGTRGQDLGAQTTNAQLGTDVSKFNVGTGADISKFNEGLNANSNQFNAGAMNANDARNADYTQAANAANAGYGNQFGLAQGGYDAARNSQDSLQGFDASKFNAGSQNDVNQYLAGLRQNNQQFNAGQTNDVNKYLTGLNSQVNMYNAGQQNDMGSRQGQLDLGVGANNLNAATQWGQMDDAQKRAYLQYISESQGQSINGANGLVAGQQNANNARWKAVQDIATGIAGAKLPVPGAKP